MRRAKILVQFRLDPDLFEKLEQHARAANTKPAPFARDLVARALTTRAGEESIGTLLQTQNHALLELRRDVRLSVETLLIAGGKMESDEAQNWVRENLPAD